MERLKNLPVSSGALRICCEGRLQAGRLWENHTAFYRPAEAVLKALSEQDKIADICLDKKGNPEPDISLRDNENVPLKEDIWEYFKREVLPHVPDAWVDESKTVKGYEINITKYFYKYKPLRSLEEIRTDILEVELETQGLMNEVVEI